MFFFSVCFHCNKQYKRAKNINITPYGKLFISEPAAIKFTVIFLNIRTPKKFVLITLKLELYGSTIE